MSVFATTYHGRAFAFDLDLLLVLAVERMERAQCRPHTLLDDVHAREFRLAVFDYLREVDADLDDLELAALLDHCVQALAADARVRRAVLALTVDDGGWTGSLCPELWEGILADFTRHFPHCHNLAGIGLLNREVGVWAMDRLMAVGLPACMHRLPYREQRRLLAAHSVFDHAMSDQMRSFYHEKIEGAKATIDSEGRRDHWA